MVYDKMGVPVTDARWRRVDKCIRTFIATYPLHWAKFKKDLDENRTEYQESLNPDGKRSQWRNTAAFPVVYRHGTSEDGLTGQEEDDLVQVASLVEPLKVFLPGLLEPDKPGAPNKLYREFLKRYPIFLPGRKF